MILHVYTDGGSRGNPGKSGSGVVIKNEKGEVMCQESRYLGIKTNNEAEYMALIGALRWILGNKNNYSIEKIEFLSDSQLLVFQMMGKYKVKAAKIIPLYLEAIELLRKISSPNRFKHIYREENMLADMLANQAMGRQG